MPDTMQALVFRRKGELALEERPIPKLLDPTDAIVRVTASSICTSDLHIRNGAVPRAREGVVLGHEFVGEVVEVGPEVPNLAVGMRVAANVETFCGVCEFCREGHVNNCLHGGWELGCRIDGAQAEYVRVPFAQNGLDPIPEELSFESALLVGDVLASGYFGAELAEVKPGDVVVVVGAGPVGLCAMQCATVFGAARVVALDVLDERLDFARRHGFASDAANPDTLGLEGLRALLAELGVPHGADAVIECAGTRESFELSWQLARPSSTVAVVALYEEDQALPLPRMYGKNLTFRTGGVDAVHSRRLLSLIREGRIDTRPLLTHTFRLKDIMQAYHVFENRLDGCVKCVITP